VKKGKSPRRPPLFMHTVFGGIRPEGTQALIRSLLQ
jgi:hypothetical protein